MIHRFHAGYGFHLAWLVLVNVLDQLGLGVRRAGDENGIGVGESFDDGMKVLMICSSVTAPDRIGLVMDVFGRMLWMDDEPLDIGRTEMKNTSLPVVDPDDGEEMMGGHVLSPFIEP